MKKTNFIVIFWLLLALISFVIFAINFYNLLTDISFLIIPSNDKEMYMTMGDVQRDLIRVIPMLIVFSVTFV
ncbi:MAG: hypothetical protein ACK5NA_09550, partial [Enterococcus sp.]